MASKDSFWRGVLQNAIGNFLAGSLLLFLGRAWIQHRFDSLVLTMKGGLNQITSVQEELSKLEHPAKAPRTHGGD